MPKSASDSRRSRDITEIRIGMPVIAGDRHLGSLEEIDPDGIHVAGQFVPMSAVTHITTDGIYLHEGVAIPDTGERPDDRRRHGRDGTDRDEVRIPVAEERLDVAKRPVYGEVEVRTSIDEEEQRVPLTLTSEEVEVERVPVNRVLDSPAERRQEGDWLIIPVMEEQLVVEKRLFLKEELRIRVHQETREEEVRGTIRRQRVDVVPTDSAPGVRVVQSSSDSPQSASNTGSKPTNRRQGT